MSSSDAVVAQSPVNSWESLYFFLMRRYCHLKLKISIIGSLIFFPEKTYYLTLETFYAEHVDPRIHSCCSLDGSIVKVDRFEVLRSQTILSSPKLLLMKS